MTISWWSGCVLFAVLFFELASGASSEGKEIADKFGDDLSFASKQFIRGFTAIFAPIIDTANQFSNGPSKTGAQDPAIHNFQRVLFRDGVNALGKGVKASATILTVPARVVGTGLEEARKAGQAGVESRIGTSVGKSAPGKVPTGIEDGTKLTSALLNTTAGELTQANFGAILLESALKKRIQDIGNRTTTNLQSNAVPKPLPLSAKREAIDSSATEEEEKPTSPRAVDALIEQINEAVRRNDERVLNGLREVLKTINPPKD